MAPQITRLLLLLLITLNIGGYNKLSAQHKSIDDENVILDRFVVLTDRDIYISGESLLYSITQISSVSTIIGMPATIAYVELLSTDNNSLLRQMVRLESVTSSFALTIPDSVSTGLYVLRVYTSNLKGGSAVNYAYRRVFVINPVKAISTGHYYSPNSGTLPERTMLLSVKSPDKEESVNDSTSFRYSEPDKVKIELKLNPESVGQRSKVSIGVKMTDMMGAALQGEVIAAVAKRVLLTDPLFSSNSLVEGLNVNSNDPIQGTLPSENNPGSRSRVVEFEGHLLKGQILNKETYEPISGIKILLAVRGQKARTYFTTSDADGRFVFVTNDYGVKEIVIMPVNQDITNYYVEVNDPFSEQFIPFERVMVSVDTTMLGELNSSIIASQISGIYESNKRFLQEQNPDLQSWDFYGNPTSTVRPSDYIALESIREVVKEVLPSLYVVRQNGVQSFRIYNKIKGLPVHTHPLVMVDGIPLLEIDGLLKLKPEIIKKIDLVTVTYYSGAVTIGGVAAFYSYDGTLEIDENNPPGFRRLYTFYEPESVFNTPDYSTSDNSFEHEADFRNTLYWNPVVTCDSSGEGTFSFYTGDESGDYVIVVSYVTEEGKVVRSQHNLKVK